MPSTLPLELVADELARLRAINPLVHLLTNEVVQEITANVLLEVGASPAMIVAQEEVASFAAGSAGIAVVSAICGQDDPGQATAILRASVNNAIA